MKDDMEISRISAKGQVTIPKKIRNMLKLNEGDRVAFLEENGKVVITKASLVTLKELQNALEAEAKENEISKEDVLKELESIRGEMWNERKS